MSDLIECPFCGEKCVKVVFHPPTAQTVTTRGSGQSSTKIIHTKGYNEVVNGCSKCGKSRKAIQNKLEGKLTEEEIVNRCVWCGKPTEEGKIECKECE